MFNYLLIWVLYILVLVLILLVAKAAFQTMHLKKSGSINYLILQENLLEETAKLERTKEKTLLVEGLQKILFKRYFKIIEDILLMQKFIFDNYVN
ncbi:hypothetical protein VP395_15240 [Mariniflexile soesokkakense]|uniref:Uncharacterized protein n=2 Tax=Mariniflexile soesokkakense TaxID=1343160 RepID=A0ABV0AEU9_9FLAO